MKLLILLPVIGGIISGCSSIPAGAPVEFTQAKEEIDRADDEDVDHFFPQTLSRAEQTLDRSLELYETALTYKDPRAEGEKRTEAVRDATRARELAANAREATRRMRAWDSDIVGFNKRSELEQRMAGLEETLRGTEKAISGSLKRTEANFQQELAESRRMREELQQQDAAREPQSEIELTSTVAYFDSGSSKLAGSNLQQIQGLARTLRDHPQLKAEVVGHADTRGSADRNRQLAALRAQSVVDELLTQGVERARISIRSAGEAQAKARPNETAKLQLDRRVEVHLAPESRAAAE